MASFLKYTDVPVFANFVNENTDPIVSGSAHHLFAATEAALSINPSLSPNRFLGKTQVPYDFATTGPLEGKFSFTFYPLIELTQGQYTNIHTANQLAFFGLTGDFVSGHKIKFSNFLLKQCYLQNFSIKINPYQPISVSANFISYDITELKDVQIAKYADVLPTISKDSSTSFEALHGLTTNFSGSSSYLPETKVSIEINSDSQRTPIYTIGKQTPDSVVLNSLERTTTIQGENVGSIVGVSGANVGSTNLYLLPLRYLNTYTPSSATNAFSLNINGKIINQDLSVSQNSILNGKLVIKEIFL